MALMSEIQDLPNRLYKRAWVYGMEVSNEKIMVNSANTTRADINVNVNGEKWKDCTSTPEVRIKIATMTSLRRL
ncbi:hypothetical protein DPMN_181152 [Dreissena polymorpha]|uniref:Uncharacterized protein n=1 Tax=Dreissena polymorpha TaxID=45954 RepID=A0A9D4DEQ5_DREPO|nr:hypothetical protein DPMN_181152 [Dreissena polymorpha]